MDQPAQVHALIQSEVKDAISGSQNKLLEDIDALISNRLSSFQKNVMDTQKQLSETQLAKMEEMTSDSYTFKRKGNEEQHKVNVKAINKMKEASSALQENPAHNEHTAVAKQKISEGIDVLTHRQKLIKLADQSENGWKTVTEYETHNLAENSEDEKRILRAESRAARKIKTKKTPAKYRNTPYDTPRSIQSIVSTGSLPVNRPGKCFQCGKTGHWRKYHYGTENNVEKISRIVDTCKNLSLDKVTSSYKLKASKIEKLEVTKVENNIDKIQLSPIGRLKASVAKWEEADASSYILDVIRNGYKLPFYTEPETVQLRNNASALTHKEFVEGEILKLLSLGCIKEVKEKPRVINPLTVAQNKNKLRLVLDCRHINPHLYKYKFKYEDTSVALNVVEKGDFLFSYDLKSAYHHIEIFPEHTTYLGFAWQKDGEVKYYVYYVLPFGVSVAGFIFTKVTRTVIKYWRKQGIRVIMYLDDGLGMASSFEQASVMSSQIRTDLESFGFMIAHEKSDWVPKQLVKWLGFVWDTKHGLGLKRRLHDEVHRSGLVSEDISQLTDSMTGYLLESRSVNTFSKYYNEFKRWENFISSRGGTPIPAQPIHVALYLTFLMDNKASCHVIQSSFYSIKWAHNISGQPDPTENSYVRNLLEASKRQPHKPRVKKDHITSDIIIELCNKYSESVDLGIIRDLAMIVMCFAGFLRYNEISALRCKDIYFRDNYLQINIDKSKTDQYRLGHNLVISKGESAACPLAMLQKYFRIAGIQNDSEMFLFRPLFRSRGTCALIHKNKPLSYTRARECIVARLKECSGDLNIGLHSLRAGGATVAANSEVNERCWKRHGRWRCDSSKDGYVADSLEKRLMVTKSLGI